MASRYKLTNASNAGPAFGCVQNIPAVKHSEKNEIDERTTILANGFKTIVSVPRTWRHDQSSQRPM
jgi:hypothetical protein